MERFLRERDCAELDGWGPCHYRVLVSKATSRRDFAIRNGILASDGSVWEAVEIQYGRGLGAVS